MAVWLSGLVLLFCCQVQAVAMEVESCPLAKLAPEHCDKGNADSASTLITNPGLKADKCCVFIAAVFEKTRKLERPLVLTKPADEPGRMAPQFALVSHSFSNRLSYDSYIHAANKIFIRHRVFRI